MLEYFAAFQNGLINILPFSAQGQQSFLFMLVGIFIGFWVGILPGLGGATTLALMLPFIYSMDPTTAFAFLLGANAVTSTTGDITSILFGVPGEGITAATVVDGHPMAKNGEAGRALGAALMSSLVGSIFGAIALAIALAIVRPLVLSIGSAEFFMLALLGITFLSSLSGGNLIKGLIGGGLGLSLAMVGLDPIESVPRFTLEPILGEANALFLWDGVALVAVTIGLFAIPEIVDLAVQRTSIARTAISKMGGVMQGIKDTFHHWRLVLRCSALGAYVGVLPGVGGGTAQWVAYAHAVQSSPDKERFGQGAVEGVLGPGAANNSTRGGDLVTTVAFGIPSSVSTAILLGAFIIQGIVPGPDLLNPAKHLTLTASFVWILIVANIITVGICFLFLKPLAKITFVKGTLLIPFLLLLVFLGAFAIKNSLGDMIVVLVFGALGLFMVKFDWPRPPLLLGLVLGGIAETNLFIATRIYGASWLTHPGVLVIALLIALGMLYPAYEKLRTRRQREMQATSPIENASKPEILASTKPTSVKARIAHASFALFFVAIFAFIFYQAKFGFGAWEPRAALFPLAIGIPCLLLSVFTFFRELCRTERPVSATVSSPEAPRAIAPYEARNRTIMIAAWIVGFFLAIWVLGFPAASALATFLYLKFSGTERWPITITLAFFAWLSFYGIFDQLLHVPFPKGQLLVWMKQIG